MKKNLDPIKYCPIYLKQSCNCVDNVCCNVNNCFMLKNFLKKKKVTFISSNCQYNGFIRKYEDGIIYIIEYNNLDEYVFKIKDYNKKFFLI